MFAIPKSNKPNQTFKQKEKIIMSSKNTNKLNVPEARAAMNKFKMEAANEVGVNLKQGYNGDLTSREAGSVGGQMVRQRGRRQPQAGLQRRPDLPRGRFRRWPDGQEDETRTTRERRTGGSLWDRASVRGYLSGGAGGVRDAAETIPCRRLYYLCNQALSFFAATACSYRYCGAISIAPSFHTGIP